MNFSGIKNKDVSNGVGFGVSLFVSGCRGRCVGCFNPETWSFKAGEEFTDESLNYIFDLLDRPYVDFFSILGGDPLEPENRLTVLNILIAVKDRFPDIKLYLWSRMLYEDVKDEQYVSEIFKLLDYYIDGSFILSKKDLSLRLRGSSNQRVIDMKRTLVSNGVVIAEDLLSD